MPVWIDGDGVLRCPRCDGRNLHQGQVAVSQRLQEDGDALVVLVARGHAPEAITSAVLGAPGRRDSLDALFECEECGTASTLRIWQHKGETFVEWI